MKKINMMFVVFFVVIVVFVLFVVVQNYFCLDVFLLEVMGQWGWMVFC